MTGPRRAPPPGDPDGTARADQDLERELERWMAALPDEAPAHVAESASRRTRSVRQRPALLAGLFAPDRGASVRPLYPAVGALVLIVIGLLVGIQLLDIGGGVGGAPTPSAEPTASASESPDALADRVTNEHAIGLQDGLAAVYAFDSIWAADATGQVLRVDPSSGSVTARIDIDGVGCGPLTATAQSIWFATCGPPGSASPDTVTVVRIDARTNQVVQTFEDGTPDGIGVATLGGGAWYVSDVNAGTLVKVNEATGAEMARLELGIRVRYLTAGYGSLWISPIGPDLARILRIDPATGETLATVALSGDAGFVLTGPDGIWVAEPFQWLLGQIDPTTDQVAAEWLAPVGANQIVVDEVGQVWVLGDTELAAIDSSVGDEVQRFAVPPHTQFAGIATYPLAAGGGWLWWADTSNLLQVDPGTN